MPAAVVKSLKSKERTKARIKYGHTSQSKLAWLKRSISAFVFFHHSGHAEDLGKHNATVLEHIAIEDTHGN